MKPVDATVLRELLDIIQSLETGEELQYSCKSPIETLLSLKGEIEYALDCDPVLLSDC